MWRDNNKELVRFAKPVMKEGLIVSFTGISYHFKQIGEFIWYKVFNGDRLIMKLFVLRLGDGRYRIMDDWYADSIPIETRQQNVMSVCTVHLTLMAYMQHHVEYVTERKQRVSTGKKNKHGKPSKKIKKLGRRIYELAVPQSITTEKRKYTKSDKPFPVCGHPRKYKSGKVIWIESYTKGDKIKQREPVSYHI
jgi:hypothetical protein